MAQGHSQFFFIVLFGRGRSWNPPCTLQVDYWTRTPEMQAAKDAHVDAIDAAAEAEAAAIRAGARRAGGEALLASREARILATTLAARDVALEPNLFPYATPPGIEHWTLWSRRELRHVEICAFVAQWCAAADDGEHHLAGAAASKFPQLCSPVVEWNYEDNVHRSFLLPHVHVFLRRAWAPQAAEPDDAHPARSSSRSSSADDCVSPEGARTAPAAFTPAKGTGPSRPSCCKRPAPAAPRSDEDEDDACDAQEDKARGGSATAGADEGLGCSSDSSDGSSGSGHSASRHEFDGAGGGGGGGSSSAVLLQPSLENGARAESLHFPPAKRPRVISTVDDEPEAAKAQLHVNP
jgi:uncharacterized membrane protein YgcG